MIELTRVKHPKIEENIYPVFLSGETMKARKDAILNRMKENDLDSIVVWADLEHGSNFEYLVGFLPRFEEALLVLHKDGTAEIALGNENLNKASKSRIPVTPIHMPHFSLPNQPMKTDKSVSEILEQCNLSQDKKIGLVGWKNFTSKYDENSELFDLPAFIVEALKKNLPDTQFVNATFIFIGENGIGKSTTINSILSLLKIESGTIKIFGKVMSPDKYDIKKEIDLHFIYPF